MSTNALGSYKEKLETLAGAKRVEIDIDKLTALAEEKEEIDHGLRYVVTMKQGVEKDRATDVDTFICVRCGSEETTNTICSACKNKSLKLVDKIKDYNVDAIINRHGLWECTKCNKRKKYPFACCIKMFGFTKKDSKRYGLVQRGYICSHCKTMYKAKPDMVCCSSGSIHSGTVQFSENPDFQRSLLGIAS